MHRVDHSSAVASLPTPADAGTPGFFSEGNPGTGQLATKVPADWLNSVQEELTGVVIAGGLTPDKTDNTQLLAALQSLIAAAAGAFVGDVKIAAIKTPPVGYLKMNGLSIGNVASGATARANADVFSLYEKLWTDWDNTVLPIQNASGAATTRGATALADWNALKRMPLPEARGEFLRMWDDGRGVDSDRVFGSAQADAFKSHTHTFNKVGDVNGVVSATTERLAGVSLGETAQATDNGLSIVATGGTETRPRNIALSAFIRYK